MGGPGLCAKDSTHNTVIVELRFIGRGFQKIDEIAYSEETMHEFHFFLHPS